MSTTVPKHQNFVGGEWVDASADPGGSGHAPDCKGLTPASRDDG